VFLVDGTAIEVESVPNQIKLEKGTSADPPTFDIAAQTVAV